MQQALESYREFLTPGSASKCKLTKSELNQMLSFAAGFGIEMPVAYGASQLSELGFHGPRVSYYLAKRALLLDEFHHLKQLLDQLRVEPIFFKGIVFAETLYSNPAFRTSQDIDVLIAAHEKKRLVSCLRDAGYLLCRPMGERQLRSELYSQHAVEFYHPERGVMVDVHWSIFRPLYGLEFEPTRLFRNPLQVEIDGQVVNTLSEIDQILVLAISASRENWQKLNFVGDLFQLLHKTGIEVRHLKEEAERRGIAALFEVTILIAAKILKVELTAGIEIDQKNQAIAEWLVSEILQNGSISEMKELRLQLAIRDSYLAKFKFVLARLFIPHDSDWIIQLPDILFFFYYLIKPFKTIGRALAKLA